MKKRIVGILLAVLACTAAFGLAVPVRAAKKETVYVVKRTYSGKKVKDHIYETFVYRADGLLKSGTRGGMEKMQYSYDEQKRIILYKSSFNEWHNYNYSYDSKGRLVRIDSDYTNISDGSHAYDGLNTRYTYDSKGRVIKEVTTGKGYDYDAEKVANVKYTITYTYSAKGLLKEEKHTRAISGKKFTSTTTYSYDAKNNLKKATYKEKGYSSSTKYTNTYDKSGRLTKATKEIGKDETVDYGIETIFYEYKKISVPKNLVKAVKAQQWQILNPYVTGLAIPNNNYEGM